MRRITEARPVSNVREIIRLESLANKTELETSTLRWAACRLINEELRRKTYRQLSQEITAAGGKGSIGHLERMGKCWKLVGAAQYRAHRRNFENYPNFTDVYQSEEVRGTTESSGGRVSTRQHGGHEDEDMSVSGLIAAAEKAIMTLEQNRAYWPLFTDDNVFSLENLADNIGVLISRVRR